MSLRYWLPAVAMMLGWGLRGFIGGGPFGAMIPGAMVVLAICYVNSYRKDVALLAAFGAIGVGFGGEMTYGQTVGFSVHRETMWWGLLGLSLKGAIWGLLGGAVIGMGFSPRLRLVAGGSVAMIVATWFGWKWINEPKLIYFSNLLDKPREEIWAGFLLAAIALLLWLRSQQSLQPALRFALAGFVGGAIGFGGGGAIQALGRIYTPELKLHWWKYMEFFFGFCFGWGMAWAMAHTKLPVEEEKELGLSSPLLEVIVSSLVACALFGVAWQLPVRFGYMVGGCGVLILVTHFRWLAPHVAYSITFAGVALDSARYFSREHKLGPSEPAYAVAIVMSLAFAWQVCRQRNDTRRALEFLMWSCVIAATFKFMMPGWMNAIDHVAIGFILMAALVSYGLRRCYSKEMEIA